MPETNVCYFLAWLNKILQALNDSEKLIGIDCFYRQLSLVADWRVPNGFFLNYWIGTIDIIKYILNFLVNIRSRRPFSNLLLLTVRTVSKNLVTKFRPYCNGYLQVCTTNLDLKSKNGMKNWIRLIRRKSLLFETCQVNAWTPR